MNNVSVFATGTMRSGGSLFQNFMSVHSEIIIFSGFVNFFRFYDGKYGEINKKSLKKILSHLKLRLKFRRGYEIDDKLILNNLDISKINSYSDCYRLIMEHLNSFTNKTIWGEYVTMGWRYIPKYLEYFPNGKAIHIIRDPRAVLTSFGKMSIMPEGFYLNSIFNWIDSYNYSKIYSSLLPNDRYKIIEFEKIHQNPKKEIMDICNYLNVDFEENMINSENWDKLFDKKFVDANFSSYSKKKVYGFNIKRTLNWKKNITKLEKFICDFLLSDMYLNNKSFYNIIDVRNNMIKLSKYPHFIKSLNKYLIDKKGTDKHVLDPTKPENWDDSTSSTGKFIDTNKYLEYVKIYNKILNS